MLAQPVPFGRYLLVELIGQGRRTEVYRALGGAGGSERAVALKLWRPYELGEARARPWIAERARAVAQLAHVNLARWIDHGVVEETLYVATELVDGVSLGALVAAMRRAGEAVAPSVLARVVAEAARGLAFAHGRESGGRPLGLLHRNITPSNILVGYAGEVKLTDFAILATEDAPSNRESSPAGPAIPPRRYQPPEQAGGEPLDARADVFALGVVLEDALAGAVSAGADGLPHPPAGDRESPLAPLLREVARRAGAPERTLRHPSAADLERDLMRLLDEHAPWLTRSEVGALVTRCAPPRREIEPQLDDGEAEGEAIAIGEGGRRPASEARPPPLRARAPRATVAGASLAQRPTVRRWATLIVAGGALATMAAFGWRARSRLADRGTAAQPVTPSAKNPWRAAEAPPVSSHPDGRAGAPVPPRPRAARVTDELGVVEDGELRHAITASRYDAASRTLTLELRVTNLGVSARSLDAGAFHLGGVGEAPSKPLAIPEHATIPPGRWRIVRLEWIGLDARAAERAALVLPAGQSLRIHPEEHP